MNTKNYDVILVGVGEAGCTLANKLSQAGLKVLGIEFGSHFKDHRHDFVENEAGVLNLSWKNFNYVVEGDGFLGIPNLGENVGGGTLVWTAMAFRYFERDFQLKSKYGERAGLSLADWPLTYQDLESYYTESEKHMGVACKISPWDDPKRPDYPNPAHCYYSSSQMLEKGMDKLGIRSSPGPAAINSQPYQEREVCVNCGYCRSGCRIDAKYQADKVMLPAALNSGNFDLKTESVVIKILTSGNGKKAKGVVYLDKKTKETHQAKAKVVVVCNNPMETVRLFFNSADKNHPNGLGNQYDQLGRYFFAHPTIFGVGVTEQETSVVAGYNMGNIIMTLLVGYIMFWNRGLISNNTLSKASETKTETQASPRIIPVQTMSIKPVNSYQVSRVYTGTVTPRRTTELGFERTGKVTRILVEEGDFVAKNQPLAYLDTGNLQNTLRQLTFQREGAIARLQEMEAGPRSQTIDASRAVVKDLEAQLELAHAKNIRRQKLYEEGAISREQLDESSSEVTVLKARLEEANKKLDELSSGTRIEQIAVQRALIKELETRIADVNLNLSKSVLKAPFNSRISIRRIDEGTVIPAGESILRLVEMENLEVRIGLPTSTAYRLRKGSYQQLTIGEQTYRSIVESILPEVDSSNRTLVTVVFRLQMSPQAQVAVGQIARLELTETIRESGYWLPVTSLAKSVRGLWSCYVLEQIPGKSQASDENQLFKVKQQDVEVLYVKGDQMLVRGTLTPNDLVIRNGGHRFVPEQIVRRSKAIN